MTDKEFKHLSKAQLLDIIYQLQLQIEDLNSQKKKLEEALADKRLSISDAGNVAEAALILNKCFESAQAAAEQYLNEIKARHQETEKQCEKMLASAKKEAARIVTVAKKTCNDASVKKTVSKASKTDG